MDYKEEQELDKELSEWIEMEPYQVYPTGIQYTLFTESLDLCFEHLIPKLKEVRPGYELNLSFNSSGFSCSLDSVFSSNKMQLDYYIVSETPSLALCIVICSIYEIR